MGKLDSTAAQGPHLAAVQGARGGADVGQRGGFRAAGLGERAAGVGDSAEREPLALLGSRRPPITADEGGTSGGGQIGYMGHTGCHQLNVFRLQGLSTPGGCQIAYMDYTGCHQ
jgi:hypothetical protein